MRQGARHRLQLVLLLIVCLGCAANADADGREKAFADAYRDLDQLKKLIKSPRAINEDFLQYLRVVGDAYSNLEAVPKRDRYGNPVGAIVARSAELVRFRAKAQKLFLDCLVLVKRHGWRNVREPVNMLAAEVLGDTAAHLDAKGRERLSARLIRVIDRRFLRAKRHDVSGDLLSETFDALAALGRPSSIEWILGEHVHANERQATFLRAALKSLVHYKDVPGRLRYAVVRELVKTFVPIEFFAAGARWDRPEPKNPRGWMAKRLWANIGPSVVAAIKYYGTDARGHPPHWSLRKAAATMQEFETWFRRHKDPRKAPWVDPKPVLAK